MKRRFDWFVVATAVVFAVSCSGGGGCGGCTTFETIPGGFPAGKRVANAVQARVSQTGIAAITANPAQLIGPLVGGGGSGGDIQFSVPSSCGGSPAICCPNGTAQSPCGPLDIDLTLHSGDAPRFVLTPVQGASTLDLTIRARITTATPLPLDYSGISCTISVDTTQGANPDLVITTQIAFVQDATAGTTQIVASNTTVAQLDDQDVSLGGGIVCELAGFGISFLKSTIITALESQIQNTINTATCKSCPGGTVAECGSPFATACTGGTCMEGSACLQELGLDGRARASSLFGSFSPGTTGAIDLYEVAGGYATTDNNGIALGLLGGMEPAAAPRDLCGPATTEPAQVTVSQSAYFQGNTDPNSQPFDVAVGIAAEQLAQFAYAGYDGGLLCLTIGHSTVAQLSTDTISLISRSLQHLVESNSPMAVGLRPQSPPTIALGTNTFTTDGNGNSTLTDPLLDIHFTAMEIDFFAAIDDQYIRVFTVVADVHLPVGLQVSAMGQLTPVIGDAMDAFTNISVKNSEAVTETPDELAGLFPTILGLVLPQLSNGLSPISLPNLGGLALSVTSITAVDNKGFLALYANLVPATVARPVHTTARVTGIATPPDEVMRDARKWRAATPPTVTLELGGDVGDLEWSMRVDQGAWTAWSRNAHPALSPKMFWLAGMHHVEVRARQLGHPETIDTEPLLLDVPVGQQPAALGAVGEAGFHGQAGAAGCSCDAAGGGSARDAAPLLLALGLVLAPLRRMRRRGRRVARAVAKLGAAALLVVLLSLPGCSCGSHPCGGQNCMSGEVARGAIGRWTSIAGDDKRVMVATYDQVLGDLVAVDATNQMSLAYTAVDGVPTTETPTYDPSTYRGGIADPGANVGAWTSIVLANHTARITYQDRDALALKYAYEDGNGGWTSYVIDAGMGEAVGAYSKQIIDANGNPAVAYLGVGVDDGMGHRTTELRLARAASADPKAEGDWTITQIASAVGTCAGLCGTGTACVAPATTTDVETCVTPTSDCSAGCGSGSSCYMGACRTDVPAPTVEDIATGTGLWVSLVNLPDGRLAATYYDRNRRALVLSVENAASTSLFTETILDGNATGADTGMWTSAVTAGDGTIHIAYQEALGDQLMYTTWNGTPGTPAVVDNGLRTGDRTHPVGAAAQIYLVSGSPVIAYQDGLDADVYLATLSGTTWSTMALTPGPLLDGFSIAATTGHGAPVLAWDSLDPSQTPPNGLVVMSP